MTVDEVHFERSGTSYQLNDVISESAVKWGLLLLTEIICVVVWMSAV